jgi:hypothetical protein
MFPEVWPMTPKTPWTKINFVPYTEYSVPALEVILHWEAISLLQESRATHKFRQPVYFQF